MRIVPCPASMRPLRECDCPRVGMIRSARHYGADRIVDLWLRARDEERVVRARQSCWRSPRLVRVSSQTKNHFGKSLPQVAMCIDAREPEILERCGAHSRENFRGGTRWIEVTVTDEVEQFPQLGVGHVALI